MVKKQNQKTQHEIAKYIEKKLTIFHHYNAPKKMN